VIGCFAAGSLILFAILVRYIHSRINFAPRNVGYGQPSGSTGQISGTGASGTNNSRAIRSRRRRTTIYDKRLILRFTIAFLSLRWVAPFR